MSNRQLQDLRVHNLPQEIDERELADSTVIVVDLLRATTTICCALSAGAPEVVPFRTIEETLAAAAKAGRNNVLLGGERGGQRIEGFDLGNSPSEYTPKSVRGRPVYITTTNGTQAFFHARLARRVVGGALVNLSAIVASVQDEPRIDILCAGTNGSSTFDDTLAAGAVVSRFRGISKARGRMDDNAIFAVKCWATVQNAASLTGRSVSEELPKFLRGSDGGRNLIDVGLERDLADCAQIDHLSIVPELDVQQWRITVR